jgi:hypothetical protein
MLAMVVNDDAGILATRGALQSIASMLAPTGVNPGYLKFAQTPAKACAAVDRTG